jgi:hypothetical protein
LPFVHAGQPILAVRGRWADPRVAENIGVTQGVHVRPILIDPCVYLISSADGPVAGDDDIDVARHDDLRAVALHHHVADRVDALQQSLEDGREVRVRRGVSLARRGRAPRRALSDDGDAMDIVRLLG